MTTAPATPFIDPDRSEPAGLPRRLAAILYDSLLLAGLLFLAMFLVVVPLGMIQGMEQLDTAGLRSNPFYIAYLAAVPFTFFTYFWSHGTHQTLGMRAWRLYLVLPDGRAPTVRHALLRCASALLSWLPLGLGFLWCLFDPERLTWHDRLSGTRLVLVR
ncbi:MAG TPA: RDD family protein [Sedimenticola thiotaurini]|uniref:RDD family protein n=1 Tax=Sedimenticola thiotaurini TaxID=1543721 RepID=A0A831W6R7_9GAMM|nr:RDD family protein [Sedimenticola thiotaurini]